MSEPEPLKLLAQDEEDLHVVGAIVQDAIAPVCDMAYRAAEKNFVMVIHRFRWDCCAGEGEAAAEDCVYERITCALDIEGVESVRYQGFDPEIPSTMLDLLTMILEEGELRLFFAGGAQLRLKLGKWRLKLCDFGDSWPTTHRPRHAT